MKRIKLLCLLLMFVMFLGIGCGKKEITSIEFSKQPLQVYTTADKLDDVLKEIKLKVIVGKDEMIKLLTDEGVKITGFDLTKPGYHTLKITYEGKELEWTYLVKVPTWNNTTNTSWYKNDETTFKITTPEELAGLAKLVNEGNTFKGKVILLENDLDLGNNPWTPISTIGIGVTGVNEKVFEGTFDGQGHTIENLSILSTHSKEGEHILAEKSYYNCGLFGYVRDATLKNLVIKNVDILNGMMNNNVRSTQGTGALVGWVTGKSNISDITVTGKISIKGEYKVGGVIGNISGSSPIVSKVKVIGDSTSIIYGSDKEYGDTNNFGGVIGYSDAIGLTIDSCVTNIKVSGYTGGGIIGCVAGSNSTINNCAVYGEVSEPEGSLAGGITGARFTDIILKNCYMLGTVTYGELEANTYADVLVGKYGREQDITVENCYYANDKMNLKILNTLEITGKKYDEIIALLPEELKIE